MNALPAELEALVLAELAKRVKVRQAATKAIVGSRYEPGDKQTFRSPVDDAKLGTVYRSDPDPEWQVVDRDALDAYLRQDPQNVWESAEIVDMDAALALLEHEAPHLLAFVSKVTETARKLAVERARAGEEIPGVAKVKPEGVLSVRPDRNAGDVIERMVAAGVITWDGRPVLEAGQEASA